MNSDLGLDGKSDATGEPEEARARVSKGSIGKNRARVSPMKLDSGSEASGRSEEDRARVSTESEVGNVDKVMESNGAEAAAEALGKHSGEVGVFDDREVKVAMQAWEGGIWGILKSRENHGKQASGLEPWKEKKGKEERESRQPWRLIPVKWGWSCGG
ncbi:hypothetical protein ACFX13_004333 [Malus domestica]